MSGSEDRAKETLKHYFRTLAEKAGVPWNSGNDAEIEEAVDDILAAAAYAAGRAAEAAVLELHGRGP
jgi:ketosteroid isomerase-like protein